MFIFLSLFQCIVELAVSTGGGRQLCMQGCSQSGFRREFCIISAAQYVTITRQTKGTVPAPSLAALIQKDGNKSQKVNPWHRLPCRRCQSFTASPSFIWILEYGRCSWTRNRFRLSASALDSACKVTSQVRLNE